MASDLTNSGVPERQENILAGYYLTAAARLREMVLHPYGKTDNARAFNQARTAQLIRQVQQIVTGLDAAAAKWVGKNVPQAYKNGLILAEQQAIDAGVRPPDAGVAGSFTLHDRRTVETFAQDTMATLHTANVSIAANITRVLRATADQSLSAREINQVLATGVIEGRPRETIRRLKEEYERVNEGGIITIVNKSGNPMTFTAAGKVGSWRHRILERLRVCPSCIFEIADHFKVPEHTISGRFSEMERDGLIAKTGERRIKPGSGCEAEVYDLYGNARKGDADPGELLGYPMTLSINAELYDRQPVPVVETWPGIPYARRADTGGVRQVVRIELVECPGCGKPLRMVEEHGTKVFRCYQRDCLSTWQVKAVNEPGRGGILALVMFTM